MNRKSLVNQKLTNSSKNLLIQKNYILKFEPMEAININILSKFKGKYLYKCLKLIVFWVILPLVLILLILLIFFNDKLITILQAF